MEQPNEIFFTISEAAEYTGRSTVTIRRWIRDKKIEAKQSKLSRQWLIPKNQLDKALGDFESNSST